MIEQKSTSCDLCQYESNGSTFYEWGYVRVIYIPILQMR